MLFLQLLKVLRTSQEETEVLDLLADHLTVRLAHLPIEVSHPHGVVVEAAVVAVAVGEV